MIRDSYLFTSESVSEGHPDKVADRISDAIVDKFLEADPVSRVALETLTTTNRVVLAGEVQGPESITKEVMEQAARDAVRKIGYEQDGFHWKNMNVEVHVHGQSGDIVNGVPRRLLHHFFRNAFWPSYFPSKNYSIRSSECFYGNARYRVCLEKLIYNRI